ncbi:MAG: hypothetical protein E7588_02205 [Ruminococcaceae bacterium]|nr:hypothetical protein [Oscillospiraceae bacterium]
MKNIFKNSMCFMKERSLIQICGDCEMLAEGCGKVIGYDEKQIVFVAGRTIVVEGEGLTMTNMENGAVLVKGKFSAIKFEG